MRIKKGIIHRDVKPSNLLAKRGDARVVDFGIAKIMDPEDERFTKEGGTPVGDAFSAPELVDDPRKVDSRCDIFSLGACWFWLLTGTTPRGRNWESTLRKIKDMNRQYETVLLKTLDHIDKRYQTMEELIQDLNALRAGKSPNAVTTDELDDDTSLVLGVLFEQYVPDNEAISTFKLEQALANRLRRFEMSVGIRNLLKREFIESIWTESWNGDEYFGYKVTETGQEWVANNHIRVSKLINESTPPEPKHILPPDDDIPF